VGRKAGIAAEIAKQLTIDGWDLVLTYWARYDNRMPWGVQAGDASAIKEQLEKVGLAVFLIESDLQRQQSPAEIFQFVRERCDSVSALILCHCESVDSGTCQKLMEEGTVSSYEELARLTRLSRSRLSQILLLANLAPAIQEQLLFLSKLGSAPDRLFVKDIRHILRVLDWRQQAALFQSVWSQATRPT
jgi:NAD(P)-dependent dehydrogenase (short-subunit alcohol dehydrogenase family)